MKLRLGSRALRRAPDFAALERARRARGHTVARPTRATTHGWPERHVGHPQGYLFAVGAKTAG